MTAALFKKIPQKTYELIAIILLAAVLVVDLGYHLITSVADEMETAPAKISSLSETLTLDCILIRDEVPLTVSGDRYLFLCEDGERVTKGTPLVACYPDTCSAEELAALSAELSLGRILSNVSTTRLDKVRSTLELTIEGAMLRMDRAMQEGNIALAAREDRELQALTLLRERLLGTVTLDALIKDNAERIAALNSRLGSPVETVYAESAGWFSQSCDGYEGISSTEALFSLKQSELSQLFDKKPSGQAPAKLILSYETYALAITDEISARRLSLNKSYRVTLDGVTLDLTLDKTVIENQSREVALIFSTGALAKTVSLRRISDLALTLKTHTGFKIPTACIAEEGGVYGVYILKGFRVEFREISIIYREENTAICAEEFEPTSYRILSENDNIIIKGEELYDGKIVSRLY